MTKNQWNSLCSKKTNESQHSAVKYLVLLRQGYCLKCENYQISSPSSKITLQLTGLVLLLSCWKRKFPISFLCLCGPNLNPVDCKIWSLVQERVYQQPISNIDELRERIVAVWETVDQRVIDAATRQWRERLLACVKARGGHFEHLLK